VQQAPGIPCALFLMARLILQASGASRREKADAYSVVIARLDRATQYSRDGSD
jgi:hypothetical protein